MCIASSGATRSCSQANAKISGPGFATPTSLEMTTTSQVQACSDVGIQRIAGNEALDAGSLELRSARRVFRPTDHRQEVGHPRRAHGVQVEFSAGETGIVLQRRTQ